LNDESFKNQHDQSEVDSGKIKEEFLGFYQRSNLGDNSEKKTLEKDIDLELMGEIHKFVIKMDDLVDQINRSKSPLN
jgi:hypothetical protein